MKVKNLEKLVKKLEKMKDIDLDERMQLSEDLFAMQDEIHGAFEILNLLPDTQAIEVAIETAKEGLSSTKPGKTAKPKKVK